MACSRETAIENLKKRKNPGGKGRRGHNHFDAMKFKSYLLSEIWKNREVLVAAMIKSGVAGEVSAQRELLDRALGRTKEVIEVQTKKIILDDDDNTN